MEWALYHPTLGYYSRGGNLGQRGDFFTSVHLGSDFGELLAGYFVQCWHQLGQPEPFYLVEMGAGQGFLAADIIQHIATAHPDSLASLKYIIIERSPELRGQQKHHLERELETHHPNIFKNFSHYFQWLDWGDLPNDSIVGCFFSNELVDAFPVHSVIAHNGQLQEVYVRWHEDHWEEVYDQGCDPRILNYFHEQNLDLTRPPYPNSYRTEVNLAAQHWLTQVVQKLQRGYLLTIDYGYDGDRYYHPQRAQGTLQCYYQQRRHSNPYLYVGEQDITTHVNFQDLQRWGTALGLNTVQWTRQALFLMDLGLGDRLQALSTHPPAQPVLLQRRDALHQLMDPAGLGNFGVLLQTKGLTPAPEIPL
jgi:SAM-dependent MidA family methyltransferase